MAKKVAKKKSSKGRSVKAGFGLEAVAVRAPNGQIYVFQNLKAAAISTDAWDENEFPVDTRALTMGDLSSWPCKRRG